MNFLIVGLFISCGADVGKDVGLNKNKEVTGLISYEEQVFFDFKNSQIVDMKHNCTIKGKFIDLTNSRICFDIMFNDCGSNLGINYFEVNGTYYVRY